MTGSPADDGFEPSGAPGWIEGKRAVARSPTLKGWSIEATVLGGCDSYEVGDGDGLAVGLGLAVEPGVGDAAPTMTVAIMPASP